MMASADELGRVATRGKSFRARAEARQRAYRVKELRAGWATYGHWLDGEAADTGKNFVIAEAHAAARNRAAAAKGVDPARTFGNMLSSQAMCFNIFAPLASDLDLATEVLAPLIPGLTAVRSITIEYTPPKALFRDQSARGGVDCDILIEAAWDDGASAIVVIETKFVEPEFSVCGFRKTGREGNGQLVCPKEVPVQADRSACQYTSSKHYRYWEQSDRHRTLALATLPEAGCSFGGPQWQLWVNHTLAHAEAVARGAKHAVFGVCAPVANHALLGDRVLDAFRAHLTLPASLFFMSLDELIRRIEVVSATNDSQRAWAVALATRYANV
jgi:hypothetical protein